MAQHKLLGRASLEDNCLVAEGKGTSRLYRAVPVFTRPTGPLSCSDRSLTSLTSHRLWRLRGTGDRR
ncbi:hypothetical protein FA15DRAFT_709535 [Coprinopsis marcescibilis]|uniref:Uncharacterized protein n=1 Tax=Coprinopsis marcescibilis TaxID=230819 RepID=A0A5C3KFQ2_COPMA|nr:hypothetical protein FA15DRAFT_709535 [Coprinopsis marcescibilis]